MEGLVAGDWLAAIGWLADCLLLSDLLKAEGSLCADVMEFLYC